MRTTLILAISGVCFGMSACRNAEQDAWNAAARENTIPAYEEYLADYSDGKYASEAGNRIMTLQETVDYLSLERTLEAAAKQESLADEELKQSFAREWQEVQARHILVRVPNGATTAERDSALALARSLQRRAVDGEDFATLARRHSDEPGADTRGGDLGFFRRGTMVEAFEKAAFSLQRGQVSDVVETRYGFHIIKAEAFREPEFDFEQVRTQYRLQVQAQAVREAGDSVRAFLARYSNTTSATSLGAELNRMQQRLDAARLETARQRCADLYRLLAGFLREHGPRDQPRSLRLYSNALLVPGPDGFLRMAEGQQSELDPWGHEFTWELGRGQPHIRSPGADGVKWTADDVHCTSG